MAIWDDVFGAGGDLANGPGRDLQQGYLGKNQRPLNTPHLSTVRPDEERQLALESRGMQGEYGNLLRAQMAGRGPSLAQKQLVAGRDAAIQAATAGAAGARGANVALAGRSAGQGAGRATMGAGRDAAMLKAQEQLSAQQQFGNLAGAMRSGDIQSRQLSSLEAQANLNAEIARMKAEAQIGEGEAERGQKAYGGIMTAVGGMISDPAVKTGAMPVGAWRPISDSYTPDQLRTLSGQQGLTQPVSPGASQNFVDPYAIDREMMAARQASQGLGQAPESTESAQQKGGGGLDVAAMFKGLGSVSDPVAKTAARPNVRQPDTSALDEAQSRQGGAGQVDLISEAAKVQPYEFEYKDDVAQREGLPQHKRLTGAMANRGVPGNLEDNRLYNPAVKYGPDGLARVDERQVSMTNVAVNSELARNQLSQKRRLDALENALLRESGKGPTQTASSDATYQNLHGGVQGTEEENVKNLARRTKNEMSPPPPGKDQGYPLGDPDAHNAALAAEDYRRDNLTQAMQDAEGQKRHDNAQAYEAQVQRELARRRNPVGPVSSPAPAGASASESSPAPRAQSGKSFYPGDKFPMGEAMARMAEQDVEANSREKFVREFQPGRVDKFETAPLKRPVLSGDTDAPEVSDVDSVSADLASELSMVKDPAERKKIIRRAYNVLGGAAHPDGGALELAPSHKFLGKALKERGAKVSDKEIKDALRKEYTL